MMECQEGIIGEGGAAPSAPGGGRATPRHGGADRPRPGGGAREGRAGLPLHDGPTRRRRRCGVNCLLLAATRKSRRPLLAGSPQQAPVAALAPRDDEWIVTRCHGLTPFHGTELDQLLRNLGVQTVVATGVSVNIGILGAHHRSGERRLPGGDPARGGHRHARRVRRPPSWTTRCGSSRRLHPWTTS